MSGMVYGSNVRAPGQINPVSAIMIYSQRGDCVGKDWQILSSATQEEKIVMRELCKTAKTVADFFWEKFRLCGTDLKGAMPPFLIGCAPNTTSFSFGLTDHFEQFNFDNLDALQPEVIAHEYTHAVVHSVNPLGNSGQEGALNESLADVFAIAFKHSHGLSTDWKIGNYRDLSKPFTTNDVKQFAKADETNDYGYVHDNSLVISHGFCLAARDLGGLGANYDALLQIWWKAFKGLEKRTFAGFVAKTIIVASKTGGPFEETMRKVWTTIGFKFGAK